MAEEGESLVELPLTDLTLDAGTQSRVAFDEAAIEEYAEALAGGAEFPPALVVYDGLLYYLWDGFHRYKAHEAAGLATILCLVRPGTLEDATWRSLGANKSHGLRRSNLDKRNAVTLALRARPELSDRAIAEHCGVSHNFVNELRRLSSDDSQSPSRVGLDGRTINTSNIGKRPAPPAQALTPADAEDEPGEIGAPEVPVDEAGVPLPAQAVAAFALVPDLRAACRAIDGLVREAERLAASPLGVFLHCQSVQTHLKNAKNGLWQRRPAHVCPYCRGGKAKCNGCKGHGWVTVTTFKAAPKE